MVQLKGHRSVGGMRASIYNAMPLEGVQDAGRVHAGVREEAWLRPRTPVRGPGHQQRSPQVGLKRFPAGALRGGARNRRTRGRSWCARRTCTSSSSARRCARSAAPAPASTTSRCAALSKRGIPVFNAPGANANAVKELVLAGMLIAARNLGPALDFVRKLDPDEDLEKNVEDGKKQFAGFELPGHTLGVIGLGKIGSLVADAAIRLGMNVLGYDPHITVEAAWSLPSQVKRAASVDEVLKASRLRHAARAAGGEDAPPGQREERSSCCATGAVLLNFSRDGVVDDEAVRKGARERQAQVVRHRLSQRRAARHAGRDRAAAPGRLHRRGRGQLAPSWWSTSCATTSSTATCRTRSTSPTRQMARESPYRLAIANANVPDMLGRISHALGKRKLNIHNMLNKSQGRHGVHAGRPRHAGAGRGAQGARAISTGCSRCAICRRR